MRIGGLGGFARDLPTFVVQLSIHSFPGRNVKVVTTFGEEWAILGRDVLNYYRILLDGPNLVLEIM
jgi:hypothetical protein